MESIFPAATAVTKTRKPRSFRGFSVREFGAGEAIRTLDPNLGKVVLYP